MPTGKRKNIRVQVPFDPETYRAMKAYAEARELALGKACAVILKETRESVSALAAAITTARTAPGKAIEQMLEDTERQLAEVNQMKLDVTEKQKRK